MPYVPREPNKKLILAGIFVAIFLIVAAITFSINHFIIKENLILKKPMVLLLIGMDRNILTPQSHDNPKALPRTDTLILTFIDPARRKISLVSIPRDSLVVIPGHGLDRINDASVLGGYQLTKRAIRELTGIKVNRYAVINFEGFVKLVDLLGGVEINVDKKMRYADEYGKYTIKLDPGPQLLDGKKVLQYVRFRNEPLGDISRVERQRILLHAVYKKVVQPESLMKIPQFLELVKKYLKTDLTTQEIIQISSFARQVDPEKGFQSATLPGKFYEAYWQPDPDQVYKLMKQLKPATLKK
jgi:polyisoprenyl-teichoic acid--peptidoglycan teichoic acid transferase